MGVLRVLRCKQIACLWVSRRRRNWVALVVFGRQRGVASLVTRWVLACQNANNRSPVPADAHLELPFIGELEIPITEKLACDRGPDSAWYGRERRTLGSG